MSTECCEVLVWDTRFFDRRIARVTSPRLDEQTARQVLKWCRQERIDCLYFLADAADPVSAATAEVHGFAMKDLRVTYARQLGAEPSPRGGALPLGLTVRAARPSDLPALEEIAQVSFTDSRFYFDDRFPRSAVSLLYQVWVRQSVEGRSADTVLVLDQGGEAVGFITCRLTGPGKGEVPLAGLAAVVRGRGLAQPLYQAALDWFADHDTTHVQYVTQGRNVRAQRLLQRLGFLLQSAHVWYHKWFECDSSAVRDRACA